MVAERMDARCRKRLVLAFCLLGAGFLAVTVQLVFLMVVQHQDLTRKADRQHQKTVQIEPRRGTIYDRNGRELAVSLETDSLYAVPSAVDDPKALAIRLSPVLGLPARALERKLDGDGSFKWLARKMDPARVARVKTLGLDAQTLGFIPESRRFYPRRNLASHALGFAGMDNRGLEGIELQYDTYLSGESGWILLERDALGKPLFSEKLNYRAPSPGHDLVLTLDEVVQYLTEKELDRVMAETQARDATAIVMDPRTGAVLALATRPEFNPNAASKYQPARWKNRPVTDLYEPGSTFKVFLAAAALDAKVVRPGDRFDCSAGRIEVGGKTIHDVHRHGVLTFQEILMKS
ncbi:MAG: penicillin-binding protein 2, partial [Nitrospirae bacterium]|nr:penicillin-binding protein 2 [Nitrospirota bacterium]